MAAVEVIDEANLPRNMEYLNDPMLTAALSRLEMGLPEYGCYRVGDT